MKTASLVFITALCVGLNAEAQGVHLNTGNSLSIAFSGMGVCHLCPECLVQEGDGYLVFGTDMLGAGESLRFEMFENDVSEAPVLSRIYSPETPLGIVSLGRPGTWQDFQGVVRATMLSGEVDANYAEFIVFPGTGFSCHTVVPVPEPKVSWIVGVAIVIGTVAQFYRSRPQHTDLRGSKRSEALL